MTDSLKILAVGDPAIDIYFKPQYNILSEYEKLSGNKVEYDILPWSEFYANLMASFNGEKDYDIVMVAGHLWLADFVNKGYLSPVSYPDNKEYDKSDILPIIMEEMKVEGQTYLYPSFCDGHMILYRKSIVERIIGEKLPAIISTNRLIDIVKQANGYNGMHGIVLKAHESEILLDVLPYIRDMGADIYDSNTHQPIFNTEQGVNGLKNYLSLRDYAPKNTNTFGNEEVCRAFQQKKCVFAVTWGGQLGVVMNENCIDIDDVGFATFENPWNVTWSFAINSKSSNKDKANELLQYLTTKNIDKLVGSYCGAPVRKSTFDTNDKSWYEPLYAMISQYAKPMPSILNMGTKNGYLYNKIYEAFINKITPEQALQEAFDAILSVNEGND